MRSVRRLVPYGILVVLVAANAVIFSQRQALADWWVVRDYTAPAAVQQLAADTMMTDKAKHLFYINRPELDGREEFNSQCGDKSEHGVVLGCYHGNRQGIFLYDVTDARLQGVEQVTAAHEMLHQAYDRLSPKERQRIDKLLQDFFDSGVTEKRIKDKIDLYRETEPDALPNEMHSIFATEIAALPVELETYYMQYFSDRSKVVAFSATYEGEFTRRKDLVAKYDEQLQAIDSQIEGNKAELDARLKELNQKRAEVDKYAAQGNASAYQVSAQQYNRLVVEYNRLVDSTRNLIDEYNRIVAERNEIAVEQQELQKALDSRLTPALEQ